MNRRAHRFVVRIVTTLLVAFMLVSSGGMGIYASAGSENSGIHDENCQGNKALTRGMVVSILYRAEHEPSVADLKNPFSDVPENEWCIDAVKWAAANGIVQGGANGRFYPDELVTREHLATILYRYSMWSSGIVYASKNRNIINNESFVLNKTINDYIFDNCCISDGALPQITGARLAIPAYSQYNMPNPYGNNSKSSFFQGSALCWASCASMWISYLLGDETDRTVAIAKATKGSEDPYEWNVGGKLYEALGIMLPALDLSENHGDITRYYETLTYDQLTELINRGNPIGIGYGYYSSDAKGGNTVWRGHYILAIGYVIVGDEQFVISIDPAGGFVNTQTFSEFQVYYRDANYLWHHTEYES